LVARAVAQGEPEARDQARLGFSARLCPATGLLSPALDLT
jgi:hypothetical protein